MSYECKAIAEVAGRPRGKRALRVIDAFVVEQRRRSEGLAAVVAEWEAEHGAFTDEDLARAEAEIEEARKRTY